MTAKGKVNTSSVQINDRILVDTNRKVIVDFDECFPSATKTGETVVATTVINKEKAAGRRGYVITTGVGRFYAEPIQTMWLAPQDPAGIKRAYAEAQIEDLEHKWNAEREAKLTGRDAELAERLLGGESECRFCGGPLASDGVCADDTCGADEQEPIVTPGQPLDTSTELAQSLINADHEEALTLNSHAGKVDIINETTTESKAHETTGSAVVRLLERVHERIRQNHPEVPAVVIVTGAGMGAGGNKWGHFRPQGWMTAEKKGSIHEMFMAGETLAKGSRQVLQTMLHESAHALAETRGVKDTSRQGRWHNKAFLTTAREMGLEYRQTTTDSKIGYSAVVLTDATIAEYRDLLDALDAEIHLMVRLPGWLGGDTDGGGESIGKAPSGDPKPNTNNIKCVCGCEEPNIIRISRKVMDKGLVRCDDCDQLFYEAP